MSQQTDSRVRAARETTAPRWRARAAAALVVAGATAVFVPASQAGAVSRPAASSLALGLDTSFGSGGITDVGGASISQSAATAIGVLPACPPKGACGWSGIAHDFVVAGAAISGPDGEYLVAVVGANTGRLATSFAGDGIATAFTGVAGTTSAAGVAAFPACPAGEPQCPWAAEQGDIVVAGTSGSSVGVVAFTPAGSVAWRSTTEPPAGVSYSAAGVALSVTGRSPTGDVVVAGNAQGAGPESPLLVALGPGGAATAFGGAGSGVSTADLVPAGASSPVAEYLTGIATDPAGDLVVAGTDEPESGSPSIVVGRLTASGAADPTFGGAPAGCSTSATCAGSAFVGSAAAVSSGLALAPLAASSAACQGLPAGAPCYEVLVAGTSAGSFSAPAPLVGGVTSGGQPATGFDAGNLLSLPGAGSTGAEALDVAAQTDAGVVSGIAVSGTVLGTATASPVGVAWRVTPAGSLVGGFGSGGELGLPSLVTMAAAGSAVTAAPGGLDFAVAGTFGSGGGFALARILGEVMSVSVSLGGHPTGWVDADLLTVHVTAAEAPPFSIGASCGLKAAGYVSFAYEPAAGSEPRRTLGRVAVEVPPGGVSATAEVLALVAPFEGGTILPVTLDCTPTSTVPMISAGLGTRTVSAAAPFTPVSPGYWLVTRTGAVSSFHVPSRGSAPGGLSAPVVGLAVDPQGSGYWLVTAAGQVIGRGVASRGSVSGSLPSPIVAIAGDPATGGYWLVSRDGAVHGFSAPSFGAPASVPSGVVGAAAAPDGLGYFLLAASGRVYAFGPGAVPHGSARTTSVAMAADPSGGYWVVGPSGTVTSLGAPSHGSVSAKSVTSIATDPATGGYWVATASGGVGGRGAPWYGSGRNGTVAVAGR